MAPASLGTGVTYFSRDAIKRYLRLMLLGRERLSIPLIIGSCGTAVGDDGLAWMRDIRSGVVNKTMLGHLYRVTEDKILLVHHDAARAIKISIPRPVFSCDLEDGDCYGGQQFGPLVNIEVPNA